MEHKSWINGVKGLLHGDFITLWETFEGISKNEVNDIQYDRVAFALHDFAGRMMNSIDQISDDKEKDGNKKIQASFDEISERLEKLSKFSNEIPQLRQQIIELLGTVPTSESLLMDYEIQNRVGHKKVEILENA